MMHILRRWYIQLFGNDVELQDVRCAGGKHLPPIWTCDVDHDKRKRKVYGWEAYTICPHCKARLPSDGVRGTFERSQIANHVYSALCAQMGCMVCIETREELNKLKRS